MRKIYKIAIYLIFVSCSNTYELTEKSLEFMPYQKGDELLFESSLGGKEKITVSELESFINAGDPLDLFPDKYETLHVKGELESNGFANLLIITTGKEGDIYKFNLSKTNTNLRYPTTSLTRNELEENFKMANRETIKANDDSLPFKFDVVSFTWDINLGYTDYTLRSGEVWTLKSFIRNGKNIIN
jgi:hypothetical protein